MRVLDLFCGAGGAAMGLHQAMPDAEIVGADIRPQPRYPFEFRQADAMTFPLDGFDFIWASPPCQAYTVARKIHGGEYPDLIAATRVRLIASGLPYVIENVPGAPLDASLMLCGTMFGLRVLRHRFFETSHFIPQPAHPRHEGGTGAKDRYSSLDRDAYLCVAGHNFKAADGPIAMGIMHMRSRAELAQAIPPAYSRFIAEAWLAQREQVT